MPLLAEAFFHTVRIGMMGSSQQRRSFFMYYQPTLNDVCHMLALIDTIPRPYGDNEGDPINGMTVYPDLCADHQTLVDDTLEILHIYTRSGGEPNNRAITYLRRRGFDAALDFDQYDPYRIVGYVRTDNWTISLSDAPSLSPFTW